jgi:SAM-dependent methyltransferase
MGLNIGNLRLPPGIDEDYVIEWRRRTWGPALGAALASMGPLEGQRLLELGPNSGRISSLFAYNGAQVVGAELEAMDLSKAISESKRWGVAGNVEFIRYSGRPEDLPEGPFDLVFSKSVLVTVPQLDRFLKGLTNSLTANGRLVCVENARGGRLLNTARRFKRSHWAWLQANNFSGVSADFMGDLGSAFKDVRVLYRNPLAYAIEASRPITVGQTST